MDHLKSTNGQGLLGELDAARALSWGLYIRCLTCGDSADLYTAREQLSSIYCILTALHVEVSKDPSRTLFRTSRLKDAAHTVIEIAGVQETLEHFNNLLGQEDRHHMTTDPDRFSDQLSRYKRHLREHEADLGSFMLKMTRPDDTSAESNERETFGRYRIELDYLEGMKRRGRNGSEKNHKTSPSLVSEYSSSLSRKSSKSSNQTAPVPHSGPRPIPGQFPQPLHTPPRKAYIPAYAETVTDVGSDGGIFPMDEDRSDASNLFMREQNSSRDGHREGHSHPPSKNTSREQTQRSADYSSTPESPLPASPRTPRPYAFAPQKEQTSTTREPYSRKVQGSPALNPAPYISSKKTSGKSDIKEQFGPDYRAENSPRHGRTNGGNPNGTHSSNDNAVLEAPEPPEGMPFSRQSMSNFQQSTSVVENDAAPQNFSPKSVSSTQATVGRRPVARPGYWEALDEEMSKKAAVKRCVESQGAYTRRIDRLY